MNDRYLYRAKRIDNGEWVEGLLTIMWGQFHIINPDDENTAYPIDESTICQCTGLKDKHGKMIWENEIIKCKCGIAVVVWDKSEWRIKWVKDNIWRKDLHFWVNDENEYGVEVIGSAIDNPEMLEVGE